MKNRINKIMRAKNLANSFSEEFACMESSFVLPKVGRQRDRGGYPRVNPPKPRYKLRVTTYGVKECLRKIANGEGLTPWSIRKPGRFLIAGISRLRNAYCGISSDLCYALENLSIHCTKVFELASVDGFRLELGQISAQKVLHPLPNW